MRELVESLSPEVAVAFLWVVGIVRTTMVFMLGYLASAGGHRLQSIHRLMSTPNYLKAQDFVNRWGVFAVPLCFLTVGFQTVVILATGFTRMPLRRWIPAMVLGTFIWALIYASIGFAILAALGLEPWALPLALVIIVAISVLLSRLRERLSARRNAQK